MHISKATAVALLAASAFAGAATTAVSAGRTALHTTLAPSVPTDPKLLGSSPGAAPWVLRSGEARLRSDGRLSVSIRGLVIPIAPFNGTTGPVTTVDASLYCGDNPTPVGTSASVPISTDGNARISATFTLPAKCLIPALLIHPNGSAALYIAASGFPS
jgi:hypothetical protein